MKIVKAIIVVSVLFIFVNKVKAEEITIVVKGMVCSFCAQGIKKNFEKLEQVEKVEPSLQEKKVVVYTKTDKTLSDEEIKEKITDAGYEVVSIGRK